MVLKINRLKTKTRRILLIVFGFLGLFVMVFYVVFYLVLKKDDQFGEVENSTQKVIQSFIFTTKLFNRDRLQTLSESNPEQKVSPERVKEPSESRIKKAVDDTAKVRQDKSFVGEGSKVANALIVSLLQKMTLEDISSHEAIQMIRASGFDPISKISGNKQTGERLEISFEESEKLGFSKFILIYRMGDTEEFDRFLFGKKSLPEKWEVEFKNSKSLLEREFDHVALSRLDRDGFVTWKLPGGKLIWIDGNHLGYGEKMILVGIEYEIH